MTLPRRQFLKHSSHQLLTACGFVSAASCAGLSGCTNRNSGNASNRDSVRIWGRLGLADGRFQRPRAIAIDSNNELYVVDKTGRIQVFNTQGEFLRGWKTPEIANGKPTGISIANDGNVMVADTHYFRILFYTPEGKLLNDRTLGSSFGPEKGQMAFVTDCVQATDGTYIVSEYGQYDRLQKYSPEGDFIAWFGEHGPDNYQFARPQAIALDEEGMLWIADSCNHRVQVYDWRSDEPKFLFGFGSNGTQPGQFRYPYGLLLGEDNSVYIAEYGGHRVQKLGRDGKFIQSWGMPGREVGEMNAPWSVVQDSQGLLYVVESGNNRIQCFKV